MSVLYKHIIQVENKNVGLKVGGHKHTIAPPPPIKNVGGTCTPCPPPPPPPLPTPVYIYIYIKRNIHISYGMTRKVTPVTGKLGNCIYVSISKYGSDTPVTRPETDKAGLSSRDRSSHSYISEIYNSLNSRLQTR